MFDAVLKALNTVLEMTAPMLKKILPLTVEEHLEAQDEVLHRLLDHVEAQRLAYGEPGLPLSRKGDQREHRPGEIQNERQGTRGQVQGKN